MYEDVIATITQAVGVPAAWKVSDLYRQKQAQKQPLLQKHVDPETDPRFKAYVFMDVLLRNDIVTARWPDPPIDDRQLRNNFRALCANVTSAAANGWGYDGTFNPQVADGGGKPMLVHAFAKTKEVVRSEAWEPFYLTLEASQPDRATARPVLRTLGNPRFVENVFLSTSLISHAKCATVAPIGYVVNAPLWNLYAMGHKDANFSNDESLALSARQREDRALRAAAYPSPAGLLQQTNNTDGSNGYNEVVLLGNSSWFNTKVKVTGIFAKVATREGKLCLVDDAVGDWLNEMPPISRRQMSFFSDDTVIDAVKACANAHNLPIVQVVDERMAEQTTTRGFEETFTGLTLRRDWHS